MFAYVLLHFLLKQNSKQILGTHNFLILRVYFVLGDNLYHPTC